MPEGYKNGKPDVAWWLTQIRHGLEFRKEYASEERWPIWRQYYRGNWAPGILPSNYFFKMVRTMVPRVYFRNPSISITPTKPGLENIIFAKLMERTDNKLIRSMKMKKHMKRMVQDAWMFGTGIGKKGFGSQYAATPETFGKTEAPNASNNKALPDFLEYDYDIMSNMPWFRNAGPGSFVLPSGTIYEEDARWTAFKIVRSVEDIKADKRLKNTKEIGSSSILSMVSSEYYLKQKVHIDVAELYEIRDKKTGKVFIITPSLNDKVLLFEDDEFARLRMNAHSSLVFNADDESFWGVPDSKILEPMQLELNEIRTYTMYHRRLAISRILAKRGVLQPEEAEKMIGPNVMPVIQIDGNPMSDIRITDGTGIPQGLMDSDAIIRQDIRETQGFSRNSMGEFEGGSRKPSASEVNEVAQALGIRIDERRDMIADNMVETIEDYHPIIFNHWEREQIEEIVGPGGVPFWIKFRPRMLQKIAFNIKADPDSAIPQTKGVREQKAVEVYTLLKSNPLIDPVKLTSNLLHELYGVQFDDMMKGIPLGAGLSPQNPASVGQMTQVIQNAAKANPELVQQGGGVI